MPDHFTGTEAEKLALLTALNRNCVCKYDVAGVRTLTCGPHKMLLEDGKLMDKLLNARHRAVALLSQEFMD